MRRLRLAIIVLLCARPVLLMAQTNDQRELTRAAIEANKKLLVSANMQMTEEETQAFWPLYDEYQTKLRTINDRTVKLIEDYVESYYDLTDDKAHTLLKEALDIDEDAVKLKKKYVKKFEKELSAKIVARYFQIENKFEAVIEYELARQIPLAR